MTMQSLKKMLTGLLVITVASTSFADNMYVYKDKGGQVLLNNVSPSGNFESPDVSTARKMSYAEQSYYALSGKTPVAREKPQEFYIDDDGHVRLTKTESGELSASDKMLMKWRAEAQESEAAAKKLAKKPDAAIGMTKSQVRNKTNWGDPNYIKTTIDAHGKSEQWVYGDGEYLYFKNGKLTSIQY